MNADDFANELLAVVEKAKGELSLVEMYGGFVAAARIVTMAFDFAVMDTAKDLRSATPSEERKP